MAKYDGCRWKDLPEDAKNAAKVLGYKKTIWNEDDKIPADDKEW